MRDCRGPLLIELLGGVAATRRVPMLKRVTTVSHVRIRKAVGKSIVAIERP